MNDYIFHIFAFVAASSFTLWIGSWLLPDRWSVRRIEELSTESESEDTSRAASLGRLAATGLRDFGTKLLPDNESERTKLQNRLMHAGMYSPGALPTYLAAKMLLMVIPAAVGVLCGLAGAVDWRMGFNVGAICGCACGLIPSWYVDRKKAQRQRILRRGLPDFFDLIVSCVEAGLSLQAAIQRVTEELKIAHPKLAHEMSIVQREIRLGAPLYGALRHLGKRADLEEVRILATAVQQSQRMGGAIADTFRVESESLRTARQLRAEELANKAAVKILFPTLLFIFPAIFVVLAGPAAIQVEDKFGKSLPVARQHARK